jgi:hypothetical protein
VDKEAFKQDLAKYEQQFTESEQRAFLLGRHAASLSPRDQEIEELQRQNRARAEFADRSI